MIKVESVGRPDYMRFASARPPTEEQWWEWGALFHGANVDKRGITARPDAAGRGRRPSSVSPPRADILVENYTPRVMEQFGLGWERLHEVNPDLIMVRMPAFGLSGPWRDRTGFAQTMECLTGMAWLTGFPDGPPVLVRGACDPLAGMHAVIATMLALIERDQSGGGRLVETVMVEAALNAAAEQVAEYGASGTVLRRDGNRGPVAAPQGVYPCAGDDRWLALAVVTDEQWQSLRAVVGDAGWAADIASASTEDRRRNHDAIDAALARWTSDKDADEAAAALVAAGVPASAVIPSREIVFNPHLRSRRPVRGGGACGHRRPRDPNAAVPLLPSGPLAALPRSHPGPAQHRSAQ